MWQPAPVLGALVGDLFRYSVAALLIIVLGVILGFRPAAGALGVLLAFGLVLVFAFAISWIWIIFGMKVKSPESVMTTSFVFLMPLTFASNIFVDLKTMPAWLQAVVRHNPVTHLTDASRGLMHGNDVTADIVWVLLASAVIVAITAPVAMRMYHRER
jgi:ABC-2 type transport system permease protein